MARLLGLGKPYFDRAGVEVMLVRGRSPLAASKTGAVVHHTSLLEAADASSDGPIPLMRPARVVVDLLGAVPKEALFALADDVLWRLETPRFLMWMWDRAAHGFHRALFEEVLLPWTAGPPAGSPKEISLSRVLQVHGLPRPVRQHPVHVPGHEYPRLLDLAYPEERVAPEYDGKRAHGPRQFDADSEREDEIGQLGWLRLPAGRSDLVEPGATAYCDTVRRALRSRSGSAQPTVNG